MIIEDQVTPMESIESIVAIGHYECKWIYSCTLVTKVCQLYLQNTCFYSFNRPTKWNRCKTTLNARCIIVMCCGKNWQWSIHESIDNKVPTTTTTVVVADPDQNRGIKLKEKNALLMYNLKKNRRSFDEVASLGLCNGRISWRDNRASGSK